ncbi:MAG: histidine kinase [Saprospiraceae bacterium]|nr:histidine kinase [Saprospiraceae bacterium]
MRFLLDQRVFFWIFGETNYLPDASFSFYFSDNLYFAVYYIPSGIIYYFYKRNQALQSARIEAERQRAEAEISHLRSQINPHFLFNSLNNIYSLAYEKSDKILGAIEGLSGLLRYSLYEKSDFVPFEKEWTHIQQLIKIEQLRLIDPVEFEITIERTVYPKLIPPILLLPLIENIFKHGDVQKPAVSPKINISLYENIINVQIQNSISSTIQKDRQQGIGLVNIKKRLAFIYGNAMNFDVQEKDGTFSVNLSIPTQ